MSKHSRYVEDPNDATLGNAQSFREPRWQQPAAQARLSST